MRLNEHHKGKEGAWFVGEQRSSRAEKNLPADMEVQGCGLCWLGGGYLTGLMMPVSLLEAPDTPGEVDLLPLEEWIQGGLQGLRQACIRGVSSKALCSWGA